MIVILLFAAINVKVLAASATNQNLHIAVEYLRSVAYNPALRLCREAPSVAPNVYWVASDNLLAFKALELHDSELATTIRAELVRIAQLYTLPAREGVPLSLRYDVVVRDDETIEIPPREMMFICVNVIPSESTTWKIGSCLYFALGIIVVCCPQPVIVILLLLFIRTLASWIPGRTQI